MKPKEKDNGLLRIKEALRRSRRTYFPLLLGLPKGVNISGTGKGGKSGDKKRKSFGKGDRGEKKRRKNN